MHTVDKILAPHTVLASRAACCVPKGDSKIQLLELVIAASPEQQLSLCQTHL